MCATDIVLAWWLQLIVRPLAVACTAIHGVFDLTDQFKEQFKNAFNATITEKYLKLPTDTAYIKHIRWFGPPNGTAISCKFGAEATFWDPEYSLVIQASLCAPSLPDRLMTEVVERLWRGLDANVLHATDRLLFHPARSTV